jgi:hypothetical protein
MWRIHTNPATYAPSSITKIIWPSGVLYRVM